MTTKLGLLTQELAQINPWWRGSAWEGRDPDLRRVATSGLHYETSALDGLVAGNLYVLRGPRRVGKTVAVKQRISRLLSEGVPPRSIVRVAADGWDASDIRSLPRSPGLPRLPEGIRRWWFIDEISSVKGDWISQIKWLRDNDSDFASDTVVLTGSDAPSLTRVAGELPGRRGRNVNVARTLLPVGFRSFVRLIEPDAPATPALPLAGLRSAVARDAFDDLIPWLDILVRAWESYLAYGGFPVAVEAAKRGDPVPFEFANDLFDVIFRDAFADSSLSESKTGALYARVIEGLGSPVNLASIAGDLSLATTTVIRHVGYLRDSFLSWACPRRQDRAWLAVTGAQEKIYPADPMLARLMHLRHQQHPDVDPTVLTEMQLGMAIRRRQVADGSSWTGEDRLFYWRTPTKKEIDFVSDDLGGVAIEGKYTEDRWRSESATVNASEWLGILATRNVLESHSLDKAWAIPAAMLAYLLDT